MAAPQAGGQLGHVRVGHRRVAEDRSSRASCRTGIEVQVLDHGLHREYEKQTGKKADWFTDAWRRVSRRHVEDEAVPARLAQRRAELPAKELSKGVGEWNHYYVRGDQRRSAAVGERRRSFRRHELRAEAAILCLESEGSPLEFKDLRIRELP